MHTKLPSFPPTCFPNHKHLFLPPQSITTFRTFQFSDSKKVSSSAFLGHTMAPTPTCKKEELVSIQAWNQQGETAQKKVDVVYYLSRNGQLEHPHYMQVPLSSPHGLYLRDVRNALNLVRGPDIASMYSWSSKRSYRNGFVWQDLSDDDFIHPSHGHEYILKGSLLLENLSFRSYETASSSTSKVSSDISISTEDSNFAAIPRKCYSKSTFDDLDEHKLYKAITTAELAQKGNSVSTQTDDPKRLVKKGTTKEVVELSPMSSSEPVQSMERSIEVYEPAGVRYHHSGDDSQRGSMKASLLLMNLIRCGSRRF